MFDPGGWATMFAIGLANGAVFWGISQPPAPTATRKDGICYMTYGRPVKIMALALICLSFAAVYTLLFANVSHLLTAALATSAFVTGTLFIAYQVFLVRFAYDRAALYFDSPFCKDQTVPWDDLEYAASIPCLQVNYIVVSGIGRIWCLGFLNGYDELGSFLQGKAETLLRPSEATAGS